MQLKYLRYIDERFESPSLSAAAHDVEHQPVPSHMFVYPSWSTQLPYREQVIIEGVMMKEEFVLENT